MSTLVIGWTTYREIVRRPLFWIVAGAASFLLWVFDFIPYFTLGEDIKMVKDQGLAVIQIAGLVIALFAASVSIADEIDGKTAITLLSKPVSRRAFLLGKFVGIMQAVGLQFLLLGLMFAAALYYKMGYDARESIDLLPTWDERLSALWLMAPALVLTFCKVAILCAVAVALSTRLPIHLNISVIIVMFFVGHLAPQLVQASSQGRFVGVAFMARFFATVLPGLEYFNVGPAISTDAVVPWFGYVLPCLIYTFLYCAAALLVGLLLFEDRDLA